MQLHPKLITMWCACLHRSFDLIGKHWSRKVQQPRMAKRPSRQKLCRQIWWLQAYLPQGLEEASGPSMFAQGLWNPNCVIQRTFCYRLRSGQARCLRLKFGLMMQNGINSGLCCTSETFAELCRRNRFLGTMPEWYWTACMKSPDRGIRWASV